MDHIIGCLWAFFFFFLIFIYLAVPDLSVGIQDLVP